MYLVTGLGNIGSDYANTRHNAGFMTLDVLAGKHGLQWQQKDRFKAITAEGIVSGHKVILAKPATFYNLAGDAVQALQHFYKIDTNNILVVHDELALPFGTLRTRVGGSDAGNNGIKSITAAIGPDFARIRLGIANEQLARQDAADFVLSRFTKEEQEKLSALLQQAAASAVEFINGNFAHTTVR